MSDGNHNSGEFDVSTIIIFLASSALYRWHSIKQQEQKKRQQHQQHQQLQQCCCQKQKKGEHLTKSYRSVSDRCIRTPKHPRRFSSMRSNSAPVTSNTVVHTRHNGNIGGRFDHHFDFGNDFLSADDYNGIKHFGNILKMKYSNSNEGEGEGDNTSDNKGDNINDDMVRSFEQFDDLSNNSGINNNYNSSTFNSTCDFDDDNNSEEISDEDSFTNSNNNIDKDSNIDDNNNNNGPSAANYIDSHLGLSEQDVFSNHTANIITQYNESQANNDNNNTTTNNSNNNNNNNSRIIPRRLIMIRHGQSEGNVNESLYTSCPDSNIRLTKLGWDQAKMAGNALRNEIFKHSNNSTVHFIVSPYVRTMETFHGLASAWCDPKEFSHVDDDKLRLRFWYERLAKMGVTFNEDPRIREQDFGNYQNTDAMRKAKLERHKFGPFYYRFPNGESASDVFDRMSTFLDSLWRSFSSNPSQNYVLVTHGISIRVLMARYFRYSIDQFNTMSNPSNCEMVILGQDGYGRLELEGRCELKIRTAGTSDEKETDEIKVSGFKFYKKLKVVPKRHMRTRNIRMDYT